MPPAEHLIDEPRHFAAHELFFSFTDEQGRIRYGNEVFTRVAGYEEAELVGQPHNLIRHPDMPRSVFRLLWDYLKAGKTIAAYVKNRAADGRYYWVLAAVTPCRDGYVSVRLNPSSPLFEAAQALYAETLKLENAWEVEHGRKNALERSLAHLSARIVEHGFDDYDSFMCAAMRAEIAARPVADPAPAIDGGAASGALLEDLVGSLGRLNSGLSGVFESLDTFESLSARLVEKHAAIEELGPSLTFLALNTHISASRLGDEGAVLSVVSRDLGERSKEADRLINTLMDRMGPTCAAAKAIAFDVSVARLETEVCQSFARELQEGDALPTGGLVKDSLAALVGELSTRTASVLDAIDALSKDTAIMSGAAVALLGKVEHMKTAQLNGKIDVASRRDAAGFVTIFEDVARIVGAARHDCDEIREVLESTGERLSQLVPIERTLCNDLECVCSLTDTIVGAESGYDLSA